MQKPVLISCLILLFSLVVPVGAKNKEEVILKRPIMSLDIAMRAAHGALKECRKRGYSVAVAVVDSSGVLQVLLRDHLGGPHTIETATRKAWTAVSFRQSTGELADFLKRGQIPSQIPHNPGVLIVGGGYKIDWNGQMVGGIGVSGAPPGKSDVDSIDGACALAGIQEVRQQLDFAE